MSGPNQHHIPQMLQRGFLAKGAAEKAWLYEPKKAPSLQKIALIGAGENFYSTPDPQKPASLDDRISIYERARLRKLLHKLRTLPLKSELLATEAAELVGHLTVRSGHLRSILFEGVTGLGQAAVELFSREDFFSQHFGFCSGRPTEHFDKLVRRMWDEHPEIAASGIPLPALNRMTFALGRENFGAISPQLVDGVRTAGEMLVAHLHPAIGEAHNNALSKDFRGGIRRSEMETFSWELAQAPVVGTILPDCCAIGIAVDGEPLPFMMADLDKLVGVIAPLSSTRLLVGRRQAAPALDLSNVNQNLACCSLEFFIAGSNNPQLDVLQFEIGRRATAILNEAKLSAFEQHQKSLPAEAEPRRPETGGTARQDEHPNNNFGYQISFLGWDDDEKIQHIATDVQGLVGALGRLIPLSRLDGITFAVDYPAALAALDRGIPGLGQPTTVPSSEGVGIAQTPMVLREGVIKARVIAQAWVGLGLLSHNHKEVAFALHTLAHQFALVALVHYVDTVLPDTLLRPVTGALNKMLYGVVSPGPDAYFAAKFSAPYAPDDMTHTYRHLARDALRRLQEVVPAERIAYRLHGDVDRLLGVVLPAVRSFLHHIATLAGHCAGFEPPLTLAQGDLGQELERSGLKAWFATFQTDLAEFANRVGEWRSFDEFYIFTTHAERILWQFQILPWEKVDGGIWVRIPLAIDDQILQLLEGSVVKPQ